MWPVVEAKAEEAEKRYQPREGDGERSKVEESSSQRISPGSQGQDLLEAASSLFDLGNIL